MVLKAPCFEWLSHMLIVTIYLLYISIGSDHGVKAKGDGWILTITLVEAQNVPASDEVGVPDPYVVFACSGQSRTSSIKLQIFNPIWEGNHNCYYYVL